MGSRSSKTKISTSETNQGGKITIDGTCRLIEGEELDLREELINTEFTHVIESVVCLEVSKGDPNDAIMRFNDEDSFISVDCHVCKRVFRSAFFRKDGNVSCTGSTGHKTGFPGQIIRIESFVKDALLLNKLTILFRWEPFVSAKYPSRESKEFKLKQYSGRHCFEYSCKYCGTKGNKYHYHYASFGNHSHHGRIYYDCKHIQLVEYCSEPNQPWRNAKEVEVNPVILKQILYDSLQELLPSGVIDMVSELASGYW